MTVQLPKNIEAYFEADREGGPDAVAATFVEEAVVRDEGKTHRGRDAIRRWKAATTQKFAYTVEPFSIATEGGKTQVKSRVSGDFPGSPVELQYVFVVAGDKIAELEITP
jgi:hypothetical protein